MTNYIVALVSVDNSQRIRYAHVQARSRNDVAMGILCDPYYKNYLIAGIEEAE